MDHVLKNGLVVEPLGVRPVMPALAKTMSSFPKFLARTREELLAVFRNGDVSAVATRVWSEVCNRFIQRLLITTGNGDLRAFRDKKNEPWQDRCRCCLRL